MTNTMNHIVVDRINRKPMELIGSYDGYHHVYELRRTGAFYAFGLPHDAFSFYGYPIDQCGTIDEVRDTLLCWKRFYTERSQDSAREAWMPDDMWASKKEEYIEMVEMTDKFLGILAAEALAA